jgi:hypothetical protein
MVDKLSKALQNSFKQDAGPAFDKELRKPKTKVNIDELLKSACSNDKINVHIILSPPLMFPTSYTWFFWLQNPNRRNTHSRLCG